MKFVSYFVLAFWILLYNTSNIDAQTQKAYERAAENAMIEKNYYAAMQLYTTLLEIEENNYSYVYDLAQAANGLNAYTFADTLFGKVVLHADSIYPLALFYQAKIKQQLGEYNEAEKMLNLFLDRNYGKIPNDIDKEANQVLDRLEWSISEAEINTDTTVLLSKLGDKYNTEYTEFGARIINDKLYYSALAYPNKKDKSKLDRPYSKVLAVDFLTDDDPSVVDGLDDSLRMSAYYTTNSKGDELYYSVCNYNTSAEIKCKIWVALLDSFGYPYNKRMSSPLDFGIASSTQPSVGHDPYTGKEVIYFSSDKIGGKGGYDIYYAELLGDGLIGEVKPLEIVNTPYDDITPYYNKNSNILFFSSLGHLGFGGFDVFYIKYENSQWRNVNNLGLPVNSSYHETHFWQDENSYRSLFSSNRLGSKYLLEKQQACCYDIYMTERIWFDLLVRTYDDRDSLALIEVELVLFELLNDGSLKELERRKGDGINEFRYRLENGRNYVVEGIKNEYLSESDTIRLADGDKDFSGIIERNLYLKPLKVEFVGRSYDKKTKNALNGVTLQIFRNGFEQDLMTLDDRNEFLFEFDRDQQYTIIATKPGYFSDTIKVDLKVMGNPLLVERDFYLMEKSIQDIVPLILYFDNDRPNPRSRAVTTNRSYPETAVNYYSRKNLFIEKYVEALAGRDQFVAKNRIKAFFEREVKDGNESLDVFSYKLIELLEAGQVIKIYIKGYASPRAGAEYNYLLGRRRVDCIRNHFDFYQKGMFNRYLAKGQLSIEEISFGSSKAPKRLTDKLSDDRESVFGLLASRERRVEIVGIRLDDGKNVIDTVQPEN